MDLNVVDNAPDRVPIRRVIVSVADKGDLAGLIAPLVDAVPDVRIYSTGGTFAAIKGVLAERAGTHLIRISDYTGQPEMQGGLVKTLDFRIYLGLLSENDNKAHDQDLKRAGAVTFDMVVGNLYPFGDAISRPDATLETARGNVDIGGPCMIRASAKNFLRVASVVDPTDYPALIQELASNAGTLCLATRYRLAQKAFAHTAAYDTAIADYLAECAADTVAATYRVEE